MTESTIIWAADRRSAALVCADGQRFIVYRVERTTGPLWFLLDDDACTPYPTAATALGSVLRQRSSQPTRESSAI